MYRLLEKDLKSVKDQLFLSINLLDYNQVCNLFLVKNEKSLRSHQKVLSKKLLAFAKSINKVGCDPKTVIFSFSKYTLLNRRNLFYLKVCNFPFSQLKLNMQILYYHLN